MRYPDLPDNPTPEQVSEWRRAENDRVSRYIATLEAKFRKDLNPRHAWRAWVYARSAGIPVPGWVLDYLDSGARNILETKLRKGVTATAAVGEALGFLPVGRDEDGRPLSGVEQTRIRLEEPRRYARLVRHEGKNHIPDKGAWNPFRDEDKNLIVASWVYIHVRHEHHGPPFKTVSDRLGISESSVRAAWKHNHTVFGLPAKLSAI